MDRLILINNTDHIKDNLFKSNDYIEVKYTNIISNFDMENINRFLYTYKWKKSCFLEEYFDTREYTLYKNNIFLLRRDIFDWQLIIRKKIDDNNIYLEIIKDRDKIIDFLDSMNIIPVKISKIDKNVLSKHMKIKCNILLRYCPIRIAVLPVNRWIIDDEKIDYNLYIESYHIDENKFINTLSLYISDFGKDIKSDIINIIKNLSLIKNSFNYDDRIMTYLYMKNKNLYQNLKNQNNQNDSNDYNVYDDYIDDGQCIGHNFLDYKRIITNKSIVSHRIPDNEMETAAIYAVKNHIDLSNAHFIYNTSHDYYSSDDERSFILPGNAVSNLLDALEGAFSLI